MQLPEARGFTLRVASIVPRVQAIFSREVASLIFMSSLFHSPAALAQKYWKIFEIGLQTTFVYRWNFLLRMAFGVIPLLGMVFIWEAIFSEKEGTISGYNYSEMIFYFVVTLLIDNFITPTDDEWQIAGEIRDGKISSYLLKPLSYFGYRCCAYLSYRLLYIAVTIIPLLLLGWFFRGSLRLPEHAATWPLFALSTAMAGGIQFCIAYSTAMLAFWVLEISSVVFVIYSFEYFFSGHVFPLDVMPDWIHPLIRWSPFTYELFFPAQVAMERIQGVALYEGLAIQAGWLVVGLLCARFLWVRGLKSYQSVGG